MNKQELLARIEVNADITADSEIESAYKIVHKNRVLSKLKIGGQPLVTSFSEPFQALETNIEAIRNDIREQYISYELDAQIEHLALFDELSKTFKEIRDERQRSA